MKINLDVLWSVGRTLLVAGGPVTALLVAMGFPPVQVSEWMGIGLAAIGVLSVAVPGIIGALKQTDAGKANTFAKLDTAGQAAVLDHIPDQTKIAAVNALDDVKLVVTKADATDGVAIATHDPALEKVVSETQTQVH